MLAVSGQRSEKRLLADDLELITGHIPGESAVHL
jgi:hypothetical protein